MKSLNTLLTIAFCVILSYGASAQCFVGNGEPKNLKFFLDGVSINKLQGLTQPDKMLKVQYTLQNNVQATRISLVVYETSNCVFSEANADGLTPFDQESIVALPGSSNEMEILLPTGPYYVYFVIGCVIDPLGPAGDVNGFYESRSTPDNKPSIVQSDYSCAGTNENNPKKVTICHIPPGNPANAHTITVSLSAFNKHHSQHGDFLGTCDSGGVIPVKLIHFSGTKMSPTEVKLNWITATEINNDYIAIEKSSDIQNWEEVCRVPGAPGGNSITEREYSCVDKHADDGGHNLVYYRPKQMDINGTYEYHNVISVRLKDAAYTAKVDPAFPNPSENGLIHIPYESSDNAVVNLRILSMEGKVLVTNSFTAKPGQQIMDLTLPETSLKSGFYILEVQSNDIKFTQKLYKQ